MQVGVCCVCLNCYVYDKIQDYLFCMYFKNIILIVIVFDWFFVLKEMVNFVIFGLKLKISLIDVVFEFVEI